MKQYIHHETATLQRHGLILGIDTGGTFTDGVILDSTKKILVKTKALTTKHDLSIGIGACIRQLLTQLDAQADEAASEIGLVCLSTTLATNAVVEGKHSRIGLIAMHGGLIDEEYDVAVHRQISGLISIYGKVSQALDEDEARAALEDMKGNIDALVVSGYFSIRNASHETAVRSMALEMLDVPVICAHELSTSLGYHERTITAIMNAHLLPVIADLIRKTKKTLRENHIAANIAIIKGDGAMMDERQALDRPVETVLSGPAASVVGGAILTNTKDALFVDLGGTTTDIAFMKNGKVAVEEDGAMIGGWKTKVRAVNMHTYGLGGDSRLTMSKGTMRFGPRKAIPFCNAAAEYPYLLDELPAPKSGEVFLIDGFHEAEALMLDQRFLQSSKQEAGNRQTDHTAKGSLSERELYLARLLADGPHTIAYLAKKLERRDRIFGIDHCIRSGLFQVISITPTDVLHAAGEYTFWNAEASRKAIHLLAARHHKDPDDFLLSLRQLFTDQLTLAIIKSAFQFDDNYDPQAAESQWFIRSILDKAAGTKLRCCLEKNIVAVGAPAEAWLLPLAERLHTKVTVPEHHEVANAIGAARSKISKRIEAMVRFDDAKGFCRIFTAWGVFERKTMKEARELALEMIEEQIVQIEKETGIYDYTRNLDEKTQYMHPDVKSQPFEINLVMELTAGSEHFVRRK